MEELIVVGIQSVIAFVFYLGRITDWLRVWVLKSDKLRYKLFFVTI